MNKRTIHAFGIGLLVFAFALFFFMVFAIVLWGPIAISILAVVMGMFVSGALLASYGNSDSKIPEQTVPEENPFVNEPKVRNGTGNGYCPECGSPLSEGDTYCGVCGRKL